MRNPHVPSRGPILVMDDSTLPNKQRWISGLSPSLSINLCREATATIAQVLIVQSLRRKSDLRSLYWKPSEKGSVCRLKWSTNQNQNIIRLLLLLRRFNLNSPTHNKCRPMKRLWRKKTRNPCSWMNMMMNLRRW